MVLIRQRDADQDRSSGAGCRFDLEAAADNAGPFTHADQAKSACVTARR
jgi:hypothetical protein